MINQRPISDWPEWLNLQIAMVRQSHEEIAAQSGIAFELACDSLDEHYGAILEVDCGIAGLLCYPRNPVKGTIVVLPGRDNISSAAGSCQALKSVLDALSIGDDDIIWKKFDC